jgi:transcriptional regulator
MLVLRILAEGPMHGYGIAQSISDLSGHVLGVTEGSLYPALSRLLKQGWADAEWGVSENKRRARFYSLTAAGRKQLGIERESFGRVIGAIARIMQAPNGRRSAKS